MLRTLKFTVGLGVIGLSGCTTSIEDQRSQCRQFASQLPLASPTDSAERTKEISQTYDSFNSSCNEFAHVIPGS